MSLTTQSIENKATTSQVQDATPKKDKKLLNGLATTGSVLAAGAAYFGVNVAAAPLSQYLELGYLKESAFSSFIMNGRECRDLFKKSGLADKGVSLFDCADRKYSPVSRNKFWVNVKEIVKGKTSLSKVAGDYIHNETVRARNITVDGVNSFYQSANKQIIYNGKSFGMAFPHEMGHALNHTGNIFTKFLHISRKYAGLLAIPILAVALLRRPTEKRGESDTAVGKTLDFVKDNCVALTAATQAPILLEEGLASIRGGKLVNGFLSPEKAKAINLFNTKAFSTYLCVSAVTVLAVWAANKVRNWTSRDTNPAHQQEQGTTTPNEHLEQASKDKKLIVEA